MHINYANFYKDLYLGTGGFIPLWPVTTTAALGDLFLVRSGKMIKVANICDPFFGVSDHIKFSPRLTPLQDAWNVQAGLRFSIKSRDMPWESDRIVFPAEKPGALLQFDYPGAYFFRARGVHYQRIETFPHFEFKLLQQLASEKFNFKEVYVITSLATVESYAMAVADSSQAFIMISIPDQSPVPTGLDDLSMKNLAWELESMQGIDYFHLAAEGGAGFFKARKLEVSPRGKDLVYHHMQDYLPPSILENMSNILTYAASEILPSVEIYPAKVHELFHFRELNLDDLALFFGE